jgi:ribonuclease VapC
VAVVLDSSAILAVLFNEEGRDQVATHLPGALVSTVNLAEAITKLCEHGMSAEDASLAIAELHLDLVPFSAAQAKIVGELRKLTRSAGLSLGDRACLALGIERQAEILTTDRAWGQITIPGATISIIR